jgi:phospholipase/carboxylesterase
MSTAFVYRFEPATQAGSPPVLLLHGTGGDENDLVPLGRAVVPGAALLSPRGKVLEHGRPRFFRRLAEGIFDEDDVRRRALELAEFIADTRERHHLAAPVAVGYSNGANIAAAVLLLRPQVFSGAILLRAMVPLSEAPQVDLGRKPVLIVSGAQDPIAAPDNAARLAGLLCDRSAAVEHRVLTAGHGLTNADVALASRWWRANTQGVGNGSVAAADA